MYMQAVRKSVWWIPGWIFCVPRLSDLGVVDV